jgi:hypothetical protein
MAVNAHEDIIGVGSTYVWGTDLEVMMSFE